MLGPPTLLAHVTSGVPGGPLLAWRFDPLLVLGLFAAGWLYLLGGRRARSAHRAPPHLRGRTWFFLAGLFVVFLALESPVDAYAGVLLSVHMVQHLLLTMVAAPLLVLGAPVTLAMLATPSRARRRVLTPVLRSWPVRRLASPFVGWAVFAVVMWGSHLRPIYEAALRRPAVHSLEHAVYLAAAVLFWLPALGVEPTGRRISHPARLLYLFVAMPVTAVLGLALYSSDQILYPYYAQATAAFGVSPLADQHLAGAIMWEGGMLLMVPLLAYVLIDWMNRDERDAARADARADARDLAR
jgi:putative membrane protein